MPVLRNFSKQSPLVAQCLHSSYRYITNSGLSCVAQSVSLTVVLPYFIVATFFVCANYAFVLYNVVLFEKMNTKTKN